MNTSTIDLPAPSSGFPGEPAKAGLTALSSSTLFQGRQEVVIRHDGQDYRLRLTRQNKLILTK